MKRSFNKLKAVAFLSAFAATSCGFVSAATMPPSVSKNEAKALPAINQETVGVANALSDAFRNVSAHVLPSVVAIENRPDSDWQTATKTPQPKGQMRGENPFKGTPFEDMFRNMPNNPGQAQPKRSPGRSGGIGSGVIIDSAGVVLTNNHVVAGGGKVIIRTQDGREFTATEVLTDPQTDIAVVKFQGDSSLVAARIGDSNDMNVGDWVVALGQPFGLESTVTAGIVSAKNRGIGITARENFIQTDAAINPGNSGGPLVNLNGEVIGINTAISSRGGGNDGIGFAVPSNLARWVGDQLIANGKVQRAYLGVAIQPVSYELSEQFGVAPRSGVAVTSVMPKTPAAKSGLESGDVIVKFGGTAVSTPQQLQIAVERSPMGQTLTIAIVRDGEPMTLNYSPEVAPGSFGAKTGTTSKENGTRLQSLGLEVSSLTDEIAKQLGMKDQNGVVITSVQDGSSSAQAGLEPGMVIAQVNRQDVATASVFQKLVKADTDGSILLLVRTENGSRFVVLTK